MTSSIHWKAIFAKWPTDLVRQGIVVTNLNEQVPFKAFMLSDEMIVFERANPDASGTRVVIMTYDQIAFLKLTAVVQDSVFAKIGFVGKLTGK